MPHFWLLGVQKTSNKCSTTTIDQVQTCASLLVAWYSKTQQQICSTTKQDHVKTCTSLLVAWCSKTQQHICFTTTLDRVKTCASLLVAWCLKNQQHMLYYYYRSCPNLCLTFGCLYVVQKPSNTYAQLLH